MKAMSISLLLILASASSVAIPLEGEADMHFDRRLATNDVSAYQKRLEVFEKRIDTMKAQRDQIDKDNPRYVNMDKDISALEKKLNIARSEVRGLKYAPTSEFETRKKNVDFAVAEIQGEFDTMLAE